MTTTVQYARRVVDNTGYTASIFVNIKIENAGDVRVFADEQQLGVGAHYSITGIGDDTGFTVAFVNPDLWAAIKRFAVVVRYPINQPSDVDNGGQFGRRFEAALDRLSRNDQSIRDMAYMAIKMPYTTPLDVEVFVEEPKPGWVIGWDITGTKLINYDTSKFGGGGGGTLPDWAAYFANPETLRNLNVNSALSQAPDPAIRWPFTAEEQLRYSYSGQNRREELPQFAGTDIGKCVMIPPAEDQTNFVAATTPWQSFAGVPRRMVPLDIRTIMLNQMESPQLFEPVMVNGFGMLAFRYVGEVPIHTVIEGTIEALVQTSTLDQNALTRHILRLTPDPATIPLLERGQNLGRQSLCTIVGAMRSSERLKDLREFNDVGGPITAAIRDNMAANPPELYVGSDHGYFSIGDTDEALKTEDALGPVGPEVQTTKWMDLSALTNREERSLAIDFAGTSTRGRIQFKRADGSIFTPGVGSWDTDGRRVYPVPVEAAYARIYYSGRGTSQASITVRMLGRQTSAANDPLKGFWDRRTFAVCRDITLWPGAVYCLEFLTLVDDGGSAREYGFRYQGGGLSFMFDAAALRKRTMKKLFREG